MAIDMEFVARVRHVLIAAGTQGLTFQELNQKCRTRNHPTADLRVVINAWQKRRWVDNYRQASQARGGKMREIWRATQLMLDQWPSIVGAVEVLLLEPLQPLAPSRSQTRTSAPEAASPDSEVAE